MLIAGWLETLVHGKKRLYVPRTSIAVGGPKSFMRLFLETAKAKQISVTHNRFAAANVALIPISMDPIALRCWKSKSKNRKVIQRLDGVFYDPQKSDFDESRSGELKELYHQLSDVLLFQSDYSKKQCEFFLGKSQSHPQTVTILNGTDLDRFAPLAGDLQVKDKKIKFITTGNFRDPEMLIPLLEALDRFEWKHGFELEVVGPIAASIELQEKERPYLKLSGTCDREQIAGKLQNAHLYLFSFLNPNCPNAVIEATACGLPVIGFDSGAMEELCGFNSELLAKVNAKHLLIHKRSELLNGHGELLPKIRLGLDNYECYRNRALEARTRFGITQSVEAYLNIIRPLL